MQKQTFVRLGDSPRNHMKTKVVMFTLVIQVTSQALTESFGQPVTFKKAIAKHAYDVNFASIK